MLAIVGNCVAAIVDSLMEGFAGGGGGGGGGGTSDFLGGGGGGGTNGFFDGGGGVNPSLPMAPAPPYAAPTTQIMPRICFPCNDWADFRARLRAMLVTASTMFVCATA